MIEEESFDAEQGQKLTFNIFTVGEQIFDLSQLGLFLLFAFTKKLAKIEENRSFFLYKTPIGQMVTSVIPHTNLQNEGPFSIIYPSLLEEGPPSSLAGSEDLVNTGIFLGGVTSNTSKKNISILLKKELEKPTFLYVDSKIKIKDLNYVSSKTKFKIPPIIVDKNKNHVTFARCQKCKRKFGQRSTA